MSKKLQFLNKKINYTISGKGNAIIFLHGFLESLKIWDKFDKGLSKDFRIICIDLPGFGESDNINEAHSMEFMADAVKAVLDAESIEQAVIVGHSMGGYVSLAFLDKYPEYLQGVVLFHSHATADTTEAKINRDRTIKIVQHDRKDFINQFIPGLFAPGNVEKFSDEIEQLQKEARNTSKEGIIAALLGMKERNSIIDLLTKTSIPIKFILGKEDSRIPLTQTLAQATLPEHSEVLILGQVGHMGFVEAKDVTMKSIEAFAGSCFG